MSFFRSKEGRGEIILLVTNPVFFWVFLEEKSVFGWLLTTQSALWCQKRNSWPTGGNRWVLGSLDIYLDSVARERLLGGRFKNWILKQEKEQMVWNVEVMENFLGKGEGPYKGLWGKRSLCLRNAQFLSMSEMKREGKECHEKELWWIRWLTRGTIKSSNVHLLSGVLSRTVIWFNFSFKKITVTTRI